MLFRRPNRVRGIKPVCIDNKTILVKTSKTSSRIRFVIPDSLQDKVLNWYHHYLQHPGRDRREEMLCTTMWWHGICVLISKTFGDHMTDAKKERSANIAMLSCLPNLPKKPSLNHGNTVCVDLIGNFEIRSLDGTIL